jgi:FemAB-related protein (PEP-CTERM system-associated)
MTTGVKPYSDEYRSAWTDFVTTNPMATVCHEVGWREVIQDALGHVPKYLLATDGARVTGVLPLFQVTTWWRARYLISIPWLDYGGVCAEDRATAEALLHEADRVARESGARFVEMRSVTAVSDNLPQADNRVTFQLRLDPDPDQIWRGFGPKLRNQVRKSEKSGLTTEIGGVEKLDQFYRVFSRNMRDLGTPVWGKQLFLNVLKQFPVTARIILVRQESRAIAGGLILKFKKSLYVPSASAYRESLPLCPNHALYWRVISEGCRDGCEIFDFGRSAIESNTFKFKKQWVPEPTQLHWQYLLNTVDGIPAINPRNPKYRMFISTWQLLPVPLANLLGPRVIKNFP